MGLGTGVVIVIISMLVLSLIHGLLYPIQNMYINHYLSNKNRSGILSFQSLFQSCVKGVAILAIGALADRMGLTKAILFSGILPILTGVLWMVTFAERKELKVEDISQ